MSNFFDLNSKVYKGLTSLQDKFEIFANYLLNDCVLYIGKEKYFLEEVEFYYHHDNHKDEYVHKTQDQKTCKQWYFHKYKTGVYKSGTYKGLDLTYGNEKTYGGILIRAIQKATTLEYVIGPCNVVNYILKTLNMDQVSDLVDSMKSPDSFCDKNPFYLSADKPMQNTIFKGPRVGLSGKYPEFMFKNYRFLKSPSNTLKYKDTLVSVLHNEGKTSQEIHNLTRISKTTIKKAIDSFEEGRACDDVTDIKNVNTLFGFYSK